MQASAGKRKVVGKYNLVAEVGHGGMADVFLAVSYGAAGASKLAVIKEPRPEMASDPDLMAMFLDEARLASRLNHPNIVQTYEVGQDGDRYFIAMEYLEGQPLSRIRTKLRGSGGLPRHMQLRVIADILAALHYAHELRDYDGRPLDVVHRDVTPQNVFVTYSGHTKLVDFGIAKAASSASETKAGVLKGKMTYMSPEQARGDRVDRRTDVFAAGVLLWEAIARQRMWKNVSDVVLLGKITTGQFVHIREVVADVPEALEHIVERAMALSPGDRYATAADMQSELEAFLGSETERSLPAQLGLHLSEAFAEERSKIQGVIEEQLRLVEPRATSDELPRIDPGRMAGTPTGVTDPDRRQSVTSLNTSLVQSQTLAAASPRAAAPGRRLVFLGAMIAGGLAAGGAFVLARPSPAPSASEASSARAAQSAVPAAGDLSPTVQLSVVVTPDNARILLDDAVLSTGKYTGKLPRDAHAYKLRVEAPGYTSRVELVTPTADVVLAITLDKVAEPAASAAASEEPAAGSPRRSSFVKPTATTPAEPVSAAPSVASAAVDDGLKKQAAPRATRKIDPENPYAK